jgi:hypothetical protein
LSWKNLQQNTKHRNNKAFKMCGMAIMAALLSIEIQLKRRKENWKMVLSQKVAILSCSY